MSDNEDILGDIGDHSLADYNLGNEEEEQLLADDLDSSQNVPSSGVHAFSRDIGNDYPVPNLNYGSQSAKYGAEESVVPNVEPTYGFSAHQTPRLPPPISAPPVEQQVPVPELCPPQRTPRVRNIPDSLDKVIVPRSHYGLRQSRTVWRNPNYSPYRRVNNVQRSATSYQRPSFPPPHQVRPKAPAIRPEIRKTRPEIHIMRPDVPQTRPKMHIMQPEVAEVRPKMHIMQPDLPKIEPEVHLIRPEVTKNQPEIHIIRPDAPRIPPDGPPIRPVGPHIRPVGQFIRPDVPHIRPDVPHIRPEVPHLRPDVSHIRPDFPFVRPDVPYIRPVGPLIRPAIHQIRPAIHQIRPENPQMAPDFPPINDLERTVVLQKPPPVFEPRLRPEFPPRFYPYNQPYIPEVPLVPQVTIRQPIFRPNAPKVGDFPAKYPAAQQVRMLPIQLPPNMPPSIPGKKVLINPHFKGNFQPPEDFPSKYIPTRIHRSPPPLSKETIEKKFGTDIDDAAERFIAEQRSALASRANNKMYQNREPQRYIENTTIEIANDLHRDPRDDDDLLRRQEAFIQSNRAGLRRRMRSPSPPRRARSPPPPAREKDEDSEYRRRVREQENLRERLTRAKELRRRKNAAVIQDRERERQLQEKDKEREKEREKTPPPVRSPEVKTPELTTLTPPRMVEPKVVTPLSPRCLTPPLPPQKKVDYDFDDLELILDDFEGILSDDEDSGRFKDTTKQPDPPKSSTQTKPPADLRAKISTKTTSKPKQKIVFNEIKENNKKKEKSENKAAKREAKLAAKIEAENNTRKDNKNEESVAKRQRIIFDSSRLQPIEEDKPRPASQFVRRVVLTRKEAVKLTPKSVPSKPAPTLFSRAIQNIPKQETEIFYDDSSSEESSEECTFNVAMVTNLPHGMTDTRLKTLAGNDVQSLLLDKEDRSAKITFRTSSAADTFKKKFNNKMVAASKLAVELR